MLLLSPPPVKYRGTITGLRISSVAGTAFIDAGAALVPYADAAHQIEIYDASSRMLRGVLKAQGTGESLTQLITGDNVTFASDTGWWTKSHANITIADGVCHFTASPAGQSIAKTSQLTSGKLYSTSFKISGWSLGSAKWYLSAAGSLGTNRITNGTFTEYLTANGTSINLVGTGASNTFDADDTTVASVDIPSADGCTIQASKTDATENFGYKNASFTYNQSSYTVIVRKLR